MAENSWPFENQLTTEAQYSKLFATALDTGVVSGLGLSAGSGMVVNVAAGAAILQGFYYENTSAKALTVGAAPAAGTARKDYVLLRLDLTANTITAVVKAGTANASGGTLPALTQTAAVWELPLGEISVASGVVSITSAMIVERAVRTGLRVIPYATSATRPSPAASQIALGVNTTTRQIEVWVSGTWYSITPDLSWSAITGKPTTFAPSAHSHSWASITGKPTEFPPEVHEHGPTSVNMGSTLGNLALKQWAEQIDAIVRGAATDATNNSLAKRDANGGLTVRSLWMNEQGQNRQHAAQRGYVDDRVAGLATKGDVDARATWSATDGLYDGRLSPNVFNRILSTNYRAVWIGGDGVLGHVPSSRRFKQNIEDAPSLVQALLDARVVTYRYRAAVREQGDRAPVEFGLIAEEAHEAGLTPFVYFDEKGPLGVNYDRITVALIQAVQSLAEDNRDLLARVDELERRTITMTGE